MERIQDAANIGRVKRFINIILAAKIICSFYLLAPFFIYLGIINYYLTPQENEIKLLAWPKNFVRFTLSAILLVRIIVSSAFVTLLIFGLCILNRAFIAAVQEYMNAIQAVPEAERQNFFQNLADIFPVIVQQTTHDPSAVSSINLSVDRLVEKYKKALSKEEFYAQLNEGNTTDIEEYIRESNEFTEDEKSHARKCLEFVNKTTGDSFKDNYSNLTLKQMAILCWKACNDRNTGMDGQRVPLSDENIKDRKNMFIKGLIDAATTYGNRGQSCAGGTYNKMVESLSSLHPSVIITLDEQEASGMIKETITQRFPDLARENLNNFSAEEQEKVRDELPQLSPETVRFVVTTSTALEKRCKQFKSRLNNEKREEVCRECINNLSYVAL
ncbi:hypothetical protein [Wolbachia endosymbiont of Ctenocephalides felis wCfeT]|uniref:hypothetical protein n=1 Tax=Wolbachia endosymbiont of Ctenocephalides felis wCfeT TaxID=2732593 RepID=UPI001445C033|nr:hypothetical protein [Wolbachia endosymbiont of Ctenocephalides felis wCfeT]